MNPTEQHSKGELKAKGVRGILWTGLSKFSIQGLQLLTTVILARLLTKEDFGVIGMAAIITVAIGMFAEHGLSASLIQKKQIHERHLSSIFWAGLLIGAMLSGCGAIFSGLLASYYRNELVQPVVSVLSIGFFVSSASIVQKALLKKALKFRKLAIIEIAGVVGNAVVSITMAFMGYGVWSLVWGLLLRNVIVTILLWVMVEWRPKGLFDWLSFKELLLFSANVLGLDIISYAISNAPYVIIGRVMGAAAVGAFTVAFNLVTLPIYNFSAIVSKVAFPAFAHMQDDFVRFRKGYCKALTYISLATFPLLSGLLIVAPEFIRVLFGTKWDAAILPVQVLCPMALLRSVGTTKGFLFMASGRADIGLKSSFVYFFPFTAAVLLGARFGLNGAVISYTTIYIICFPILQIIANKVIDLKFRDYLKSLTMAFSCTSVMIIVVLAAKFILKTYCFDNDIFILVSSILIGASVYFSLVFRVNKEAIFELIDILLSKKSATATGSQT